MFLCLCDVACVPLPTPTLWAPGVPQSLHASYPNLNQQILPTFSPFPLPQTSTAPTLNHHTLSFYLPGLATPVLWSSGPHPPACVGGAVMSWGWAGQAEGEGPPALGGPGCREGLRPPCVPAVCTVPSPQQPDQGNTRPPPTSCYPFCHPSLLPLAGVGLAMAWSVPCFMHALLQVKPVVGMCVLYVKA